PDASWSQDRIVMTRIILLAWLGALLAVGAGREGPMVRFKKTVVDREVRSGGGAGGGGNRGGGAGISAGDIWDEAQGWKPHEIRPAQHFDGATGYSNSFLNFATDVNGDGWPDQILIGFPGFQAVWAENPKGGPGPWREHVIWRSACNESPAFADLLGKG